MGEREVERRKEEDRRGGGVKEGKRKGRRGGGEKGIDEENLSCADSVLQMSTGLGWGQMQLRSPKRVEGIQLVESSLLSLRSGAWS